MRELDLNLSMTSQCVVQVTAIKGDNVTELFTGIRTATNDTSEEQLHGLESSIESLFDLANDRGVLKSTY